MSRKPAPLLQNLALLIVSLAVAALLAEMLLRLVLPAPIIWAFPQESYLFDPEIGHWLEGDQRAYTHDKMVTTNSKGLRDVEFAAHAPDGVIRILALGDSQTFGNGLARQNTWPQQLERALNRDAGAKRYEVLNAGLPASDTWQHEIILKRMLAMYRPHAVILAFYVNDVATRPETIRFSQRSDRNSPNVRWIYFAKRSALLLSLRSAYDAIRKVWSPSEGYLLQNALLRGEGNAVIDRRWNQVERSLSGMRKSTDDRDVAFLVVSLPRRDQVDGRLPADRYNQRLKVILGRYGIPSINMLGPLQSAYKEYNKSLFIPWDGHNSKIANKVIAGEIAVAVPTLINGGLQD